MSIWLALHGIHNFVTFMDNCGVFFTTDMPSFPSDGNEKCKYRFDYSKNLVLLIYSNHMKYTYGLVLFCCVNQTITWTNVDLLLVKASPESNFIGTA